MPKRVVDYSVYLVTDPTPAVLGPDRSTVDVVRAALAANDGSIGIVQLRHKNADARTLLATLKELHALTEAVRPAPVPLLINDRVDVAAAAMAAGWCEGVHLGQDDIDVATARRLLGEDALIGLTANTPDEAVEGCRAGADYIGLGTVFATPTKTDTPHVLGTAGLQHMMMAMVQAGFAHVPTVCIGGVHARNARRVLFQSTWSNKDTVKSLHGVAVVSAIMSALDPAAAAAALAHAVRLSGTPTSFYQETSHTSGPHTASGSTTPDSAVLGRFLGRLQTATPLAHNMTNLVVQNFAANVALAIGASPIMSNSGTEAADLSRLPYSSLVVNMGTVTTASLAAFAQAMAAYNEAGRPIVFDPVGAGATALRQKAVRTIFDAGYIDVIKGNEAEIRAVYTALYSAADADSADTHGSVLAALSDSPAQQRGVDGASTLGHAACGRLARALACRARCVVVLTGPTDYVADRDGRRIIALQYGHPLLGRVTGTGCALGTVLAATAAVVHTNSDDDLFDAIVSGITLYEQAAHRAATAPHVLGPGSFVPAFLDTLAACQRQTAAGDLSWATCRPVDDGGTVVGPLTMHTYTQE